MQPSIRAIIVTVHLALSAVQGDQGLAPAFGSTRTAAARHSVRAVRCQAPVKPHDVESLLAEVDHAMACLLDYRVKGDVETKGKHDRFTVYFKAPNLVRIDAHDGQVAVQPDGSIRGRLGHGLFGRISRAISRDDKRLKDDEGIPFYDSHFPAVIARLWHKVKEGAPATMHEEATCYQLEVREDKTVWKYAFDKTTLCLTEDSKWVDSRQVETAHYTNFKANTGLSSGLFKF